MATEPELESIGDYVKVNLPPPELGVEAVRDSSQLDMSGFAHISSEQQNLRNLEDSCYIDVNITSTANPVRDSAFETSFLDVNLTTEQNVRALDTSSAAALLFTRGETHMFLHASRSARDRRAQSQGSNCGGPWLNASTRGDPDAIRAHSVFLHSGIREQIQGEWQRDRRSEHQPITALNLISYKYDESMSNNDFKGFYFFRVCAGSFYLYCRVGLNRAHKYPLAEVCKPVSNKESDICP